MENTAGLQMSLFTKDSFYILGPKKTTVLNLPSKIKNKGSMKIKNL